MAGDFNLSLFIATTGGFIHMDYYITEAKYGSQECLRDLARWKFGQGVCDRARPEIRFEIRFVQFDNSKSGFVDVCHVMCRSNESRLPEENGEFVFLKQCRDVSHRRRISSCAKQ